MLPRPISASLCLLLGLAVLPLLLRAEAVRYPDLPGLIVDVTAAPYHADNTGTTDAGPAISAAIAVARGENPIPRFVYLPDGVYLIETPIVISTRTPGGGWSMLQGESREGTILRAPANHPAMADPENPVAVISFFEGDWTNNAFQNTFENMTIELGAGNPGGVGLRFVSNNVGRIDNVTIRTLDPGGAGAIGLDLAPRVSGPSIARDVLIEGFAKGVALDHPQTTAQPWLLENFTLRGQREVGIVAHRKGVQIIGLDAVNTVPVFDGLFLDGMLTMLDSTIRTPEGMSTDAPAVRAAGDFLMLRGVHISGYAHAVDDNGTLIAELDPGGNYRNGPTYTLWEETHEQPLDLPVLPVPAVPREDPSAWYVVDTNDQGDDTEALREALLSGARTVFLTPGKYDVTGTIRIGPDVERLHGNYAVIRFSAPLLESGQTVFVLGRSNRDTVVIERLRGEWMKNTNEAMIFNASNADLVLRDIMWNAGGAYRNAPHTGRLFIENVHCLPGGQVFRDDLPGWIITNQQTWARQLNPEMTWPLLTVSGGQFWLSSFKFGEQQGPVLFARNQAVVEFLGGYMNVTHGVDMQPFGMQMIDVENSRTAIRLIERAGEIYGPPYWNFRHRNIAREVRDGVERWLPTTDDAIIHRDSVSRNGAGFGGAMVPLFTTGYESSNHTGNQLPAILLTASMRATVGEGARLLAWTDDPDGPAAQTAVQWRTLSGPGIARFADAGAAGTHVMVDQPGTYTFMATAHDGLAAADSASVEVSFAPSSVVLPLEPNAFKRLTDLPPRDGVADNALASVFLYTGDFQPSNADTEQEIRTQAEVDLTAVLGAGENITRAELVLTPRDVQQPRDLELHETLTGAWGLAGVSDFAVPSAIRGTYAAANLVVDEAVRMDVTTTVEKAAGRFSPWLGLQLRMVGGANDDGTSNFVEWYPPRFADADKVPRLEITLAGETARSLRAETALFSNGLGYAPVFGGVWWRADGWMQVDALQRWLFIPDGDPNGFAVYSAELGWLWTSAAWYPHLYQFSSERWLYALLDPSDPYWFFAYDSETWEYIPAP